MKYGLLTTKKAVGDVHFINRKGIAVLEPVKGIKVNIDGSFTGLTLKEAISEARRFAEGAIKSKVTQRMKGYNCIPVVKNVKIDYKIKHSFSYESLMGRILHYEEGEQIIKKGTYGDEFFFIKEGIVDIDGMEYHPGEIFGRAPFSDKIRKRDAFAKTFVILIAINKDHPEIAYKKPAILKKFAEEYKKIKKTRPRANIDNVVI